MISVRFVSHRRQHMKWESRNEMRIESKLDARRCCLVSFGQYLYFSTLSSKRMLRGWKKTKRRLEIRMLRLNLNAPSCLLAAEYKNSEVQLHNTL